MVCLFSTRGELSSFFCVLYYGLLVQPGVSFLVLLVCSSCVVQPRVSFLALLGCSSCVLCVTLCAVCRWFACAALGELFLVCSVASFFLTVCLFTNVVCLQSEVSELTCSSKLRG